MLLCLPYTIVPALSYGTWHGFDIKEYEQMRALNLPILFVVTFMSSALPLGAAENTPPPGFRALFDGESLSGWHGMKRDVNPYDLDAMTSEEFKEYRASFAQDTLKHWTVKDGAIVNDGHGPYLNTDESFGDVELFIDYKTVPKADSGIYLRGTPQVQIWDPAIRPDIGTDKGSGGLWNNTAGAAGKHPLVRADNPLGEWNRFRIIQIGARTTIWLNDQLIVNSAIMENYWNRAIPLRKSGPVQLQTHGGEISWRNIFVREIGPEEANRFLQASRDRGFRTAFDGSTFRGWKEPGTADGVVKNYHIDHATGAIVCNKGMGSTLHTVEEYGNFVVRLEFKLPPRGNNGLAIRYPGHGDTSSTGMCELQVLGADYGDDKLDKAGRQHHGSAYGMRPAHRGYLRPVGQWNFQEVTVIDRKIKVELNGTVILDTDLGEVKDKDFMDGHSRAGHPGLNRTRGHFGFAGHSDPVGFRNIRIKRLD